jgi:putative glutamine amidotransferase
VLLPGSPADINPQKFGQAPIPECAASDPAREAVDELLLQDAFNLHKPVLAICYGIQALNVWKSGSLVQHLQTLTDHTKDEHGISVVPESSLAEILAHASDFDKNTQQVMVNSSHHQAVASVGGGLRVAARATYDGVIEAVEAGTPNHFVLGVQWHPERTFARSAASRALFMAFASAAAKWQPKAIQESVVAG